MLTDNYMSYSTTFYIFNFYFEIVWIKKLWSCKFKRIDVSKLVYYKKYSNQNSSSRNNELL